MRESGDSGINPLSQVDPCLTLGLTTFNLSKLNIITVTQSLSVSDVRAWDSLTSPFVIKGPDFAIHVYFKPEAFGGNQDSVMVNVHG